jgi:hypothetical protein
MTKPTHRKRSKIARVLLLPIFAIFFLVGWSLYWIGQKETKRPKKPINKLTAKLKEDELELILIPKEEQTLTA